MSQTKARACRNQCRRGTSRFRLTRSPTCRQTSPGNCPARRRPQCRWRSRSCRLCQSANSRSAQRCNRPPRTERGRPRNSQAARGGTCVCITCQKKMRLGVHPHTALSGDVNIDRRRFMIGNHPSIKWSAASFTERGTELPNAHTLPFVPSGPPVNGVQVCPALHPLTAPVGVQMPSEAMHACKQSKCSQT